MYLISIHSHLFYIIYILELLQHVIFTANYLRGPDNFVEHKCAHKWGLAQCYKAKGSFSQSYHSECGSVQFKTYV